MQKNPLASMLLQGDFFLGREYGIDFLAQLLAYLWYVSFG